MQAEKNAIQTQKSAESLKFAEKIGSTTYEISVYFSSTSKESIEDKILRLIEREVANNA
jgi:hypothetical protein